MGSIPTRHISLGVPGAPSLGLPVPVPPTRRGDSVPWGVHLFFGDNDELHQNIAVYPTISSNYRRPPYRYRGRYILRNWHRSTCLGNDARWLWRPLMSEEVRLNVPLPLEISQALDACLPQGMKCKVTRKLLELFLRETDKRGQVAMADLLEGRMMLSNVQNLNTSDWRANI